jgi:hypothetical protein
MTKNPPSITAITPTLPDNLLDNLNRDGFVLIPSILSKSELSLLRNSCAEVVGLTRAGKWPYMRTLPKQFPPWTDDASQGIWGVQHLLHPELTQNNIFAQYYFNDTITGAVKQLMQCEEDDLVMELFNLLCRPDRDFALKWHRDDISADATAEEEMLRLNKPAYHAQWNLALYHDKSLIVVPGSHKRPRTDEERKADPLDDNMPGQMIVEMQPGDVVFYNNNILHRGVYKAGNERMTLHGSIGHVKGGNLRARNVLQHGTGSWVQNCDFTNLKPEMRKLAEGMRERLIRLGREGGWDGSSFSHRD